MKIAINTRFLLKDKIEGIGRFTLEIFTRVVRNHPEHEFYFLFDRAYDPEFIFAPNIKPVVLFPPARHPFLWYLWFEYSIPAALKKINADLFISPDGYLSLSAKVPQLLVVHDLAHIHRPNDIPFLVRNYYNYFCPKFARKAQHIVCVSEFTKQDLANRYGIPKEKTSVVCNAASEVFHPIGEVQKNETRTKLSNGKRYFFYAGALHPRKNIETLLNAFEKFRKENSEEIKLVITGKKAWQNEEMERTYEAMTYKNEVVFTGRLPDSELNDALASAEALLYIPHFEGFGLPVIEALACETPVITSNVSSLPEVAGDAALLVDPANVADVANAMREILKPEVRTRLHSEAATQRNRFSWDTSATAMWNSIERLLSQR